MGILTSEPVKIIGFNRTVEQYYERTRALKTSIEILNRFSRLLPANARILDAGCGPGRDAGLFTDKGFRVVGIDLAEKMIEFAKRLAPKAEFRVMDLRHLAFGDSSFDAVWFNASLLNIKKEEAPQTLVEMHRVLKPNGLMFVGVKQGRGEGLREDRRYGRVEKYYAFYTRDELRQKLEDAGFRITGMETKQDREYDAGPFIAAFCRKEQGI